MEIYGNMWNTVVVSHPKIPTEKIVPRTSLRLCNSSSGSRASGSDHGYDGSTMNHDSWEQDSSTDHRNMCTYIIAGWWYKSVGMIISIHIWKKVKIIISLYMLLVLYSDLTIWRRCKLKKHKTSNPNTKMVYGN